MDRSLQAITVNRRMRLWLLLPLLLLFSQQGAWLHELSHATYSAHSHQVSVREAQSALENGVCASRQSFGQLGSALSASLRIDTRPTHSLRPNSAPQYSQPAAPPPAPRNRGPPLLA